MSDAALAVAQIVAPPRSQQSASASSNGDAGNSDSDFGAMVQSSANAQEADHPKAASKSPSGSPDAQNANSSSDTNAAPVNEDLSSKPAGKTAANGKSEKTDKKEDCESGKQTANGQLDASAAIDAAQAQLQAQAQSQTHQSIAAGDAAQPDTQKATKQGSDSKVTEGSANQEPGGGAPKAGMANAAQPQPGPNAVVAAAAAQAPNSAATDPLSKTTTPAATSDTAITVGDSAPATQPAAQKPNTAATAQTNDTSGAAFKTAASQRAQASTNTPVANDNAKGEAKKSATSASGKSPAQTGPAVAAVADSTNATAPIEQNTKDAPKTSATDTATVPGSANPLFGFLAALDGTPAKAVGADSSTETDGSSSPASTSAVTAGAKMAAAKTAGANSRGIAATTGDPPLASFEAKAKEALAEQGTGAPSAKAHTDNVPTTGDAKPAAQATAQNAPAQPAVPQSAQPQNSATIVANIVNTNASGANGTPTIHAQMDGPRLTLPADQIAVEIRRHQTAGADHFNIKIDPPELGRIDVKIEMTSDGQTKAHLTADRQDTLDLLQRDSKGLERALNSTGLKTNSDSLNFSLRQDNSSNRGGDSANNGSQGRSPTPTYYGGEDESTDIVPVRARFVDPSRVDILI